MEKSRLRASIHRDIFGDGVSAPFDRLDTRRLGFRSAVQRTRICRYRDIPCLVALAIEGESSSRGERSVESLDVCRLDDAQAFIGPPVGQISARFKWGAAIERGRILHSGPKEFVDWIKV